jgi:hypothetical protein
MRLSNVPSLFDNNFVRASPVKGLPSSSTKLGAILIPRFSAFAFISSKVAPYLSAKV